MSEAQGMVVYFVSNSKEPSEIMKKTFEEINQTGNDGNCVWMTPAECREIKSKERKSVFIFEEFSGEEFETVVNSGNRIFGPLVIYYCMKNDHNLPKKPHPVFSLAMEGIVVSCTSVEKERRDNIHKKVEWMCGEVSKDFHDQVTHLIAGEVGSKKYLVAASLKKKIMSPEWIEKLWESCKIMFVTASDSKWDGYRCAVFKGCVVTVSGLDSKERAEVRKAVEKEGGIYSGEMKINECTHLIINQPKGQKFEFAKKWKIHIVTPHWLYDSIEAGHCKEEHQYTVSSTTTPTAETESCKTSTPTRDSKEARLSSLPNVSCISVVNINETAMTTANSTTLATHNQTELNNSCISQLSRLNQEPDPLDTLNISGYKAAMFLDGTKIFLSGFTSQRLEKLHRMINLGGGTRLNHISENVTHVVIGEHIDEHVKQLQEASFRPHLVDVGWLVQCFKKKELVSEEKFYCLDVLPQDVTLSVIDRSKASQSRITKLSGTLVSDPTAGPSVSSSCKHDAMEDIMSQYLPQQMEDMTDDSALLHAVEAEKTDTIAQQQEDKCPNDETEVQDEEATQDPSGGMPLFEGKTFVVLGFNNVEEEELVAMIEDMAGQVLPSNTRKVPDYAVVSVFGYQVNMTVGDIVTNCWLQMCIEHDELLPLDGNEIFMPLTLQTDRLPLHGCVLSISGFSGCERDTLMHIAESLGAVCQEYFVKKANRGLQPSTHLVVSAPEGSKYKAAKNWKLPAVTKQWLFASGRTGTRQPEERFLIDNEDSGPDMPVLEKTTSATGPAPHQSALSPSSEATNRSSRNIPVKTIASSSHGRVEESAMDNTTTTQANHPSPERSGKENIQSTLKKRNSLLSNRSNDTLNDNAQRPQFVNDRVKQLMQGDHESPKAIFDGKEGIDTPGKFLDPNKIYRPHFDLTDALASLASPNSSSVKKKKRESLPLDEMFSKQIAIAIKNSTNTSDDREGLLKPSQDNSNKEQLLMEAPHGPLKGIVISVSKKLSSKQSEYNNIAASLGAEYRWNYDQTCTHFIFQGRNSDINKEFRLAKEHGKIIVSPHWLLMCQEQNTCVDESLFPHTFNPNMSLSLSRQETPIRPSRRSTRRKYDGKDNTVSTAVPTLKTKKLNLSLQNVGGNIDRVEKKIVNDLDQTHSDEEMAKACKEQEEKERKESGEILVNNLKTIMAATKKHSKDRRKSRRYGSTETSRVTDDSAEYRNSRPSSRQGKKKALLTETQSEASQAIITWDDPCSREQRLALASELAKDSESNASVYPQSDDDHGQNNSSEDDLGSRQLSAHHRSSLQTRVDSEEVTLPPMPDPALVDTENAVHTEKPQEPELLQDETVDEDKNPNPLFLFSGMAQQERDMYGALVEQLGGKLSDAPNYDPRCTHLVVGTPSRNEKFLACVAAGKWVLHKSYFEACREKSTFVPEELYEWGGEGTSSVVKKLGKSTTSLANAAYRWRCTMAEKRKTKPLCNGAFDGWNIILLTDKKREDGFRRLLEAGGATVKSTKYPMECDLSDVHYAFIDMNKVGTAVDLEILVQAEINCVKPEYIAAYLMENPPPKPQKYILPELQYLKKRDLKRKPSEALTPNSKRSRR